METKIYKRKLVEGISKYLNSREVIVIYGARQVGKTSLLKYLMDNFIKKDYFYFDLELPSLLEICNSGAEKTYTYLIEKGANDNKRVFLVIDEIQYLDDPAKFLKIFHDHYPNVKLIVSGSSTFEIRKKFKESLAGRTLNFELYPLSFEEFLVFKEKEYTLGKDNTKTLNDELVMLAEEFIRFGGYPKIVLERTEEKKQAYLGQIISTYIRKDIRDIGNIRNIGDFNKLVELLASQSSGLLNVLEISNTLGLNRITINEYLDLLENTFIIKRVSPFHKNLRSELSKNPKIFFMDTGLMHLLWLKEFPKIVMGSSFETFVFLELYKSGQQVNYWGTTNKQEVDFIVNGKMLHAIEAKLNFQNADKGGLRFFAEKYKCDSVIVGLKGPKKGKYVWELIKGIG